MPTGDSKSSLDLMFFLFNVPVIKDMVPLAFQQFFFLLGIQKRDLGSRR